MREVFVVYSDGRHDKISVAEILSFNSLFRQARSAPPRCFVNKILDAGKIKVDHHREATWQPFRLNENEYASLLEDLRDRFGLKDAGLCYFDWRLEIEKKWTRLDHDRLVPVLKRIILFERILDILKAQDEDLFSDVHHFVVVMLNEELEKLH